MKNIKIWACAAVVLLASCNDDFLERVPETSIGEANFFNTEEDLNIFVNSLYNFPGTGIYYGDQATDNLTTTGNTELKTMMVSAPSSETVTGGWNWDQLRSINLFLQNYDRADVSEETLNHFEGLGRFFRAQFYFNMVKRYSDVPFYDFVLETDDVEALMKPRDSRELVVNMMFEDYQAAADYVFESQPSGAVNRWVAKAFMARAALYEGTFRKYHDELGLQGTADTYLRMAEQLSTDIINNGPFALASDYAELFQTTDLGSNAEVILPVFSEDQVRNSGWSETMFGNFEQSPSKDLLQSYLMTDGSFYSAKGNIDEIPFVEEFVDRDPRLSMTYAYPGWEIVNVRTYSQGSGVYVQQLAKNFSGYHQLKGFVNVTDQSVLNSIDVPVIRFAEMLLINAEAKAELGEIAQGDLDQTVNLLRDRVGMPPLMMAVAMDPFMQEKYPGINSALLLEIRRERRVELAMEGFRMDDLMRWSAGELLEVEPKGIFFDGLGEHDLTGDDIPDIVLLDVGESIPEPKEENALGIPFVYYKAGSFGQDVGVFLSEGSSGHVLTVIDRGTFVAPKYYYRPVPASQVQLNPNLVQMFGWE